MTATVSVIRNPGMGDFSLLPRSTTDFIMEDLEAPIVFTLNAGGAPVRMTAEFAPGKTSVGRPVQTVK